jgi:uncharacterized membrane protein
MNQTRVETFSDAAFALAITLLVLSSTVPNTFEELRASLRMAIPFGISITLITVIWYQHYLFFLKFGLQDKVTITINTVLLFLILVYVYPLKFLARFLFELYASFFVGRENTELSSFGAMNQSNVSFLMLMYGLGATLIFFTLAWFYHYAISRKKELELNDYELFSAKTGRQANLLLGSVPLLSFLLVLISPFNGAWNFIIGGFTYMLYPLVMVIFGLWNQKKRKLFVQ